MTKNKIKPAVYYVLAFFIPLFIIIIALAGLGIAPFGNKSLIISDANGYYINTLSYAGRMFRGLESPLYSFEKTVGGNMTGHLNGILMTPFGFLFSMVSISDYPIVFTYISVLNFSLSGLTMYLLLADRYGHRQSNLIFSTTYALIGFNVANVFQAVFFCATAPLPIMVLGLKKIFEGKSPLIYILSIAYGLLTNAFFGFVLCVASVLFFFTGLWLRGDTVRRFRLFIRYAFSSLCGGLLAIVIWLPGFLSLRGGRLEQTSITDFSFQEYQPFLQMGAKLFTGANNISELVNGLPNIFVGILPLSLVILFFLSKGTPGRKKKAAGFLLGVYLISFWIVAFNMIMHSGTTTNWFNYRYSYVFSFILILIAAEMWQDIDNVTYKNTERCGIILAVSAILIFYQKYGFVKGGAVVLDFALLSIIYVCWIVRKRRPKANPRRLFDIITLIVVCINLFLNYRICTSNILEWEISLPEFRKTVEQVDPIVQAVKTSDAGFFRMEINRQRSNTTGNDPMLYGYNGVGHGGSNERDFVRQGLNRLGIPWYSNRSYYADGIPAATDSLLGIKYVIAEEDLVEEKGYTRLSDAEQWNLYANPNAIQIATLVAGDVNQLQIDFENVFDNLNRVWAALAEETGDVFVEETDIHFMTHNLGENKEIDAETARAIVAERDASVSEQQNSEPEIETQKKYSPNGKALKEPPEDQSYIEYSWVVPRDGRYYSYNRSGLLDTSGSTDPVLRYEGYYHRGDTVTGYLPVPRAYITESVFNDVAGRFHAAWADDNALNLACKKIQSQKLTLVKKNDTLLTGEYTSDINRQLLFTIPWDEGWSLYIDGNEYSLTEALGLFMSADIPAGTHSFEMRFVPDGLSLGMKISLIAAVVILLYGIAGNKVFGWRKVLLEDTNDTV